MAKWDKLAPSFGCQIQPATRNGNSYTQIGQCSIAGRVRHSKKILTVNGDSAYKLEGIMSDGTEPTRTSVTLAQRVGDC